MKVASPQLRAFLYIEGGAFQNFRRSAAADRRDGHSRKHGRRSPDQDRLAESLRVAQVALVALPADYSSIIP